MSRELDEPAEPITIPREVYDFLMGEAPLQGTWFGDLNLGLPGRFWWRGVLKAAAGWPEARASAQQTANTGGDPHNSKTEGSDHAQG